MLVLLKRKGHVCNADRSKPVQGLNVQRRPSVRPDGHRRAGCAGVVPDDVSPRFEGRGDFIAVFEVATPNKNTSGMTSLFARVATEAARRGPSVRLSVCLRRPARSHVPPLPVWASRLRLYPHGRTRLKPACLPVCLPGARAYQSIRSSVCLLAVCPESAYLAPELTARPSATPVASTVSSNTVLSAFSAVFISVRHNRALHRATRTHGQSQHIRSPSDICESHAGGGSPYVNQRERRESCA
ncbi:hypothetical protein M9458_054230, partial [Cirrhinus mrigala]